jgi:hemolysin D
MSAKHRLQAFGELLKHYKAVFMAHWENRHNVRDKMFDETESEFLPAALSIQEKPVSKASRLLARVLVFLIIVLVTWATFGKIDIVVNASGKIIPSDRIKSIASVDTASVRTIYVTEGQKVKAGQVLVELDSAVFDTDSRKYAIDEDIARLQMARAEQIIRYVDTRKEPRLPAIEGFSAERIATEQNHLTSEYREFMAKLRRAESEVARYRDGLTLAAQKAKDYKELLKTGDVAQHQYVEKEEARLDMDGRLRDAENQRSMVIAETKRVAYDTLKDARRQANEAGHESKKAGEHSRLLKLIAPVDGTVQGLKVLTVGGVVPAAQELMTVVPDSGPIEADVSIESKDIGFVYLKQDAAVKIDAFEYTKYGLISGKVVRIARDAVQDEKRGLLYNAKVELAQNSMVVNGKTIILTPGMGVQVEIKTGSRRVIQYLLTPLLQHKRESLSER